jgi:hypothetical protein
METLDKHFRLLAKAAFARHGFASEQLFSQWEAVVGPAIGKICLPSKISWPQSAGESARKIGGTLVLRAVQGHALELNYENHRIIERVNQFLGYGAIQTVKILQSNNPPKPAKPAAPQANVQATSAWAAQVNDIADANLKNALQRLALHVAPHGPKPTSPQGKIGIGLAPQTQLGKTHG